MGIVCGDGCSENLLPLWLWTCPSTSTCSPNTSVRAQQQSPHPKRQFLREPAEDAGTSRADATLAAHQHHVPTQVLRLQWLSEFCMVYSLKACPQHITDLLPSCPKATIPCSAFLQPQPPAGLVGTTRGKAQGTWNRAPGTRLQRLQSCRGVHSPAPHTPCTEALLTAFSFPDTNHPGLAAFGCNTTVSSSTTLSSGAHLQQQDPSPCPARAASCHQRGQGTQTGLHQSFVLQALC